MCKIKKFAHVSVSECATALRERVTRKNFYRLKFCLFFFIIRSVFYYELFYSLKRISIFKVTSFKNYYGKYFIIVFCTSCA